VIRCFGVDPGLNTPGMQPFDSLSRIEGMTVLDRPVAAVRTLAQRALSRSVSGEALPGVWRRAEGSTIPGVAAS
jgi:hypothetical protein